MFSTPDLSFDLSPVRLSYVAALRGVLPRKPEGSAIFAQTGDFDPFDLLCLAASNPSCSFYGLIQDTEAHAKAKKMVAASHVGNVAFVNSADQIPAGLDYLCDIQTHRKPLETDAIYALAESRLKPSGLFCCRYKAYENPDEALQFLIEEYTPDLADDQALGFLDDIQALGTQYFTDHPIALASLEKARATRDPSAFFSSCLPDNTSSSISGAFEVMKGLLPRGFSFAGDADVPANYLQLSVPTAAHDTLDKCREHLFYEPIKDFAASRLIRNDVWVRQPVQQTQNQPDLFGYFTFGITTPREKVPTTIAKKDGEITLNSPLFLRLIDLMCTLPLSIGDFLSHPDGQGMDPDDVISAIHVLVACGLAQPMRSRYEGQIKANVEKPLWSNAFNEYLTHTPITGPTVRLASPIVGGSLRLSAREALVLQAIHRVGVSNSAGILQPELQRLVDTNPSLAAQIMETVEPTDEVVHTILTSTLSRNIVRWYAYGLLAA